jgi:hypothetical protein
MVYAPKLEFTGRLGLVDGVLGGNAFGRAITHGRFGSLRGEHLDVRGEFAAHRLGQHKGHIGAQAAEGFGQPVTGGAQSPADEGRELPPEHEHAHDRP